MKKIGKFLGIFAAAAMFLAGCTFSGTSVLSEITKVEGVAEQNVGEAFNPEGLTITLKRSEKDVDVKYDEKIAYRFSFAGFDSTKIGRPKMTEPLPKISQTTF